MPKAKKEAPEEELPPLVAEDELDDGPDAAIEEDEDDEADPIDVPASAAGKASALRLLDMLVEKEALALSAKKPGPSLIEAVAKVLESPGSLSARATKLSDAIVDSEDVDDLFVDDDVLVEILKRW